MSSSTTTSLQFVATATAATKPRQQSIITTPTPTTTTPAFQPKPTPNARDENSLCWLSAKERFRVRINQLKHPPSQENIDDFLKNNVNVNKAISECEKLKAKADKRYEGPLGKLLGVLSVLKEVGDSVLTCAPESVSIAWGIISFLVGIGTNDMENCGQISEASTNIVTIILNCRLYENRYDRGRGDTEKTGHGVPADPDEAGERVMEGIKELITVVLEFFWYASRKFREDKKIKKFCDIFSIKSTANEKYENVIVQYKNLREMANIEFEDKVIGWLHDIKENNAEIAERLKGDNEKALRSLLLPELHEIKDKLDLLQADVTEVKVDVKAVRMEITEFSQDMTDFRHETNVRDLERITRERFQKCYADLKPSDIHIRQFSMTLSPLKRKLGYRHISRWLFDHESYIRWQAGESKMIYIKGHAGFGKSVTMAVAIKRLLSNSYEDLRSSRSAVSNSATDESPSKTRRGTVSSNDKNIRTPVIFFFFRRGDDETQLTETAISSLLAQLFNFYRDEPFEVLKRLIDALEVDTSPEAPESTRLDQATGKKTVEEETVDKTPISDSSKRKDAVSHVDMNLLKLENIASVLNEPVYIVIDGIDECTDFQNFGLVTGLIKLGRSTKACFRIMMSSRVGLDLEKFFAVDDEGREIFGKSEADVENDDALRCVSHHDTTIMTVTKASNEHDMKVYLEDSLTELLNQGGPDITDIRHLTNDIATKTNERQARDIKKMVDSIQKKADGMFTYSAMTIASLKQPSPLSIKQRIKRLPDQMDNLYARHLESLTTAQRKLVLIALNRIVWTPEGVNVIEIIEQFKQEYAQGKDSPAADDTDESDTDENEETPATNTTGNKIEDPVEIAMDRPEIIYTIYHLETAGREFFKFSLGKRKIDVIHKSVRDWVEKEAKKAGEEASSLIPLSEVVEWGDFGELKFTLPRQFIEGNSASRTFKSEAESHLDILIHNLETVTSQKFQKRYMPLYELTYVDDESADTSPVVAGEDDPGDIIVERGKGESYDDAEKNEEQNEKQKGERGEALKEEDETNSKKEGAESNINNGEDLQKDGVSRNENQEVGLQRGQVQKDEALKAESQKENELEAEDPKDGSPKCAQEAEVPKAEARTDEALQDDTAKDGIQKDGVTKDAIPKDESLKDGGQNYEDAKANVSNDDTAEDKDGEDPNDKDHEAATNIESKEEKKPENSNPKKPTRPQIKNLDTGVLLTVERELPEDAETSSESWKVVYDRFIERGEIAHFGWHLRKIARLWPREKRQGRKWTKLRNLLRKLSHPELFKRWSTQWRLACQEELLDILIRDEYSHPGLAAAGAGWEIYLDFLIEDTELNYSFEVKSKNYGMTALHRYCIGHFPEQLEKIILKAPGNLTVMDYFGYTPLMRVLSFSQHSDPDLRAKIIESLKIILEHDPSPDFDIKGHEEVQPGRLLRHISNAGDPDLLKLALEKYAPVPNQSNKKGQTLLHTLWNWKRGNDEIEQLRQDFAKKLLEMGFDPNAQDVDSTGPLYFASVNYNVKGVELLLRWKANVHDDDVEGYTALFGLASSTADGEELENAVSIVKILRAAGADINVRTKYGTTPLMAAMYFAPEEMVKLLLEMYTVEDTEAQLAYLKQRDISELTVLHREFTTGRSGARIRLIVEHIVSRNPHPDTVIGILELRFYGNITLMFCAIYFNQKQAQADLLWLYYLYGRESDGKSFKESFNWRFYTSRILEDRESVQILKVERRDVYNFFLQTQPHSMKFLGLAISTQQSDIIKELIDNNVDALQTDEEGWDAFDWAWACGQTEIVKELFPQQFSEVNYDFRKHDWKAKFNLITSWDSRLSHSSIRISEDVEVCTENVEGKLPHVWLLISELSILSFADG
ncbi:hypothetical protein AA313_de0209053 [Arthrobotrys entomopaga]|nr:hypothetical protein AA313_de0209053 [Arthrobotrys entomopaga]